jgi:hypothetical protein
MKIPYDREKPKTEFFAPECTDSSIRRFWLYVARRQRLQTRLVGILPFAQVTYHPPPAPQQVHFPLLGCPDVKLRK